MPVWQRRSSPRPTAPWFTRQPPPIPRAAIRPIVTHAGSEYRLTLPSKAAAFYVAGIEAVLQNNKLVALWCFLEAARRNPAEPIYLNNLGFALLQYRLHDLSILILDCAKSLAADFTSPYLNAGYAHAGRGDFAQAAVNYLTAWLRNPADGDYLRLLTDALSRSPELSEYAWLFDYLLTKAAEDRSAAVRSPAFAFLPPGTAPSAAFGEVDRLFDAELADLASRQLAFHRDTVLPTLHSIEYVQYPACLTEISIHEDDCQRTHPVRECDCVYEPRKDQCRVVRQQGRLNVTLMVMASEFSLVSAAHGSMRGILEDHRARLSAAEQSAFVAYLDFDWRSRMTAAMDEVAESRRWLSEEKAEVLETMDFYCSDLGFVKWVYTGEGTLSIEPTFCLVVFCLSYDVVSGEMGLSASAILTGKLTIDPLTGDITGLSTGLGGTYGLGPLTVGGGVMLKFSPTRVGVEPKLSIGPIDLGYFMGLQQLSSAAPPGA